MQSQSMYKTGKDVEVKGWKVRVERIDTLSRKGFAFYAMYPTYAAWYGCFLGDDGSISMDRQVTRHRQYYPSYILSEPLLTEIPKPIRALMARVNSSATRNVYERQKEKIERSKEMRKSLEKYPYGTKTSLDEVVPKFMQQNEI